MTFTVSFAVRTWKDDKTRTVNQDDKYILYTTVPNTHCLLRSSMVECLGVADLSLTKGGCFVSLSKTTQEKLSGHD